MEIEKIIEEIKKMSILELNELIEALSKHFNVSGAVAMAPAAATGTNNESEAQAPKEEEKTEFKLVIKEISATSRVVEVIKLIKEVTGAPLLEAKALAKAGSTIKDGASKEDSDALIAKFKAIGVTLEAK